jgi:hypothetical protein
MKINALLREKTTILAKKIANYYHCGCKNGFVEQQR